MTGDGRNTAEESILKHLLANTTIRKTQNSSEASESQRRSNDSLDLFLINCGVLSQTSLTTLTPPPPPPKTTTTAFNMVRQRSIKEELAFYLDRVQGCQSFQEFWSSNETQLPHLFALVGAFNI